MPFWFSAKSDKFATKCRMKKYQVLRPNSSDAFTDIEKKVRKQEMGVKHFMYADRGLPQ